MRRVILVREATTRGTRRACFAPEDPLDGGGRRDAQALRGALPSHAAAFAAPCLAAFQTASLAGCAPVRIEPALADCAYGRWSGRALADVGREEPGGVEVWRSDPDATPHGGESLRAVIERVARWLEEQAGCDGCVVAVASAAVVRAAVVSALRAPAEALSRIDVAPASVTELHVHLDRVTVTRVNDRVTTRLPPTARPDALGTGA